MAASACAHPVCELIGEGCSLAITRSRGCRPGRFARAVAPAVFAELLTLVAALDAPDAAAARAAAVRLAQIVRAEALEERNLLAHARADEPELAARLAPWIARRDPTAVPPRSPCSTT